MTGEVDTPPGDSAAGFPPEKSALSSADSKPVPDDPNTETSSDQDAPNPEKNVSKQTGVFSAWGFDVNAVAGNIGGFFTSPAEDEEEEQVDQEERDPKASHAADHSDEIGATATTIANAATAELEHASKAAHETFGKAAQEIGKGWGTLNTFLDDILAAKPDSDKEDEDVDIHASFRKLFPDIEKDDEVVDHFKCTLLQKYRCYLNNSTPEKTYPLRGRLFVSTSHIALYVTDDGGAFGGKPFGVSVPFADVAKIQKGAKSMLRLLTKSQSSYIFAEFESDSHYSGALSLLEHMTGAGAPPPKAADGAPENTDTKETQETG